MGTNKIQGRIPSVLYTVERVVGYTWVRVPPSLQILFIMNRDIVREGLLYLQEQGWSDLIDSRWRDDVIKEIKTYIPNISDTDLNEILNLVLI